MIRLGVRIRSRAAITALERFDRNLPGALTKGMLRFGFLVGRRIAENIEDFKLTKGTRRLSRSFVTPSLERAGAIPSITLGKSAPIYAAIHEFGGIIRAVRRDYLVFQTPDGSWHSVKEVHIREKRYVRNAVEDQALQARGGMMIAETLVREFAA